jgi:hypothetical protein
VPRICVLDLVFTMLLELVARGSVEVLWECGGMIFGLRSRHIPNIILMSRLRRQMGNFGVSLVSTGNPNALSERHHGICYGFCEMSLMFHGCVKGISMKYFMAMSR